MFNITLGGDFCTSYNCTISPKPMFGGAVRGGGFRSLKKFEVAYKLPT